MLIDWFTVVAQAVNFLILVWLLKRFLYKPILHAIDEREKRIAGQLHEAEQKKAEAKREQDEYRRKNEEFDEERTALLKRAVEEAHAERQRLLDEARKDSDSLRSKRQEALRNEERSLSREIGIRTQQEVFAIARKALADLATVNLEDRMAEVFVHRLRALNGEEKSHLAAALKASPRAALVRSAFAFSPMQRAAVEKAIKETLATATEIQFQTAPDLVSGVELTTNGHKVAWSIADYLASLEKSVGELLNERPNPEPNADLTPRPEQRSNERAT